MFENMCIWRHKLCSAKTVVGPTLTMSSEPLCTKNVQHGAKNEQHGAENVGHGAESVRHGAENVRLCAKNVWHGA